MLTFHLLFSIYALTFTSSFAAPAKVPSVFLLKAESTILAEELSYPAKIESKINANILAPTDGMITQLPVSIGSAVKKNSTVAHLRKNDPGYEYAPQKISAPVNGIISALKITLGSQVSRGEVLAQITDPQQLKLTIEVAAQDISYIKIGQQAEFHSTRLAKPAELRVLGVSPLMDSVTGTSTAELQFLGNVAQLMPGTVGFVRFRVNERSTFVIPEHALHYSGKNPFVRVVENEVARKVMVTTGARSQGRVEIVSGLKNGDQVIERASDFVADGEKSQ